MRRGGLTCFRHSESIKADIIIRDGAKGAKPASRHFGYIGAALSVDVAALAETLYRTEYIFQLAKIRSWDCGSDVIGHFRCGIFVQAGERVVLMLKPK
jgi:hypothetical protein